MTDRRGRRSSRSSSARGGETVRVDFAGPVPESLRRPRPRRVARRRRHAALVRAPRRRAGRAHPRGESRRHRLHHRGHPRTSSSRPCEDFLAGASGFSERLMLAVTVRRGGAEVASLHRAERRGRLHHGDFAHDPSEGAPLGHPRRPLPRRRRHRGDPDGLHGLLDGRRRTDRVPRDGRVHPDADLPVHPRQPPDGRAGLGAARGRGGRQPRRPGVALTVDGQETMPLESRRPGARSVGRRARP